MGVAIAHRGVEILTSVDVIQSWEIAEQDLHAAMGDRDAHGGSVARGVAGTLPRNARGPVRAG